MRAIRKGLQGCRHSGGELQGRVGPGPGKRSTCAMTKRWPWPINHVILKNACKEIAHLEGQGGLTFMAKWNYELAGNSCHIHASLWNKARHQVAVFQDRQGRRTACRS